MPLVIGHEFSGVVAEVGRGVTDVHEGDHVAIEPVYRCGECRPCKSGRYNLCTSVGFHGLMADGGMAEYTVVPATRCTPFPKASRWRWAPSSNPWPSCTTPPSRPGGRPE